MCFQTLWKLPTEPQGSTDHSFNTTTRQLTTISWT